MLGKHLNREEVQLCLNDILILRGNLKKSDAFTFLLHDI